MIMDNVTRPFDDHQQQCADTASCDSISSSPTFLLMLLAARGDWVIISLILIVVFVCVTLCYFKCKRSQSRVHQQIPPAGSSDSIGDVQHTVVPKTTLWNEPVLKVYFMGEQTEIKYKQAYLQSWMVMNIVKEGWNFDGMENAKHAPCFEQAFHASDAHIRVKFESKATSQGGSWSKLGCQAQTVRSLDTPTMVLNLRDCTDDFHKESTILHEFGHALGLGHEHQHPEYLEVMKKFIDIDATMYCYGIEKLSFYREQYGELNYELMKTEYDVHSIMHYPTKVKMLKKEYCSLRKPEDVDTDPATKDLSEKERGMLKNFLLHIDHVPNKPSKKDKKTIAQAYYENYKKTEEYEEEQLQVKEDVKATAVSAIKKVSLYTISEVFSAYKKDLQASYNHTDETDETDGDLDVQLGIAADANFIELALVKKKLDKVDSNDSFLMSTLWGGIDVIMASTSSLPMKDILLQSNFILVEGRPGVGKSVFSLELCRQWDTLESLQDYKLVLRLELRNEYVQKAASLSELFQIYSEDPELCTRVEEEVSRCNGEGVLFVLDGFDELPSSIVHNKKSLIMAIVSGKRGRPGLSIVTPFLPKATRLVTSRPSAVHECFPKEQRHVEILGFTDDCKEQYAESAFKSKPELLEHFKKFMRSNPVINALMHIPLNCAIAAQLCRDRLKYDDPLPKTTTQLYKALIHALIRRDMMRRCEWDKDTPVPAFENLMEEISGLKRLCEEAYNGLLKKDIQLEFPKSAADDIQCLGLMKKTTKRYVDRGKVPSFSFLHLSIQEFLAAWYVSCNPELVSKTMFISAYENGIPIHFGLFLAGMIGTKRFSISGFDTLYQLQCFYESQVTNSNTVKPSNKLIFLSNAMDMHVFAYALTHITFTDWHVCALISWDILVSCLPSQLSGAIAALKTFEKCLSVSQKFKDLLRSVRKITLHLISNSRILDEFLPNTLWNIEEIRLGVLGACHDDQLLYSDLEKLSNLKHLHIDTNCISKEGVRRLVKVIKNKKLLTIEFFFGRQILSEKLDLDQILIASLNSPTVKKIAISGFPFKFDSCYVTKKMTVQLHVITPGPYSIESHGRLLSVKMFDWLNHLCSITDIPSINFNLFGLNFFIPPSILCDCINTLNRSLNQNLSMKMNLTGFCLEPCDLKYLSRALRRDPAIPHRTIKRSRSLCDLTTLDPQVQCPTKKTFADHHHSCPDLLEIESLHQLRDNLRTSLRRPQRKGKPAITPWLARLSDIASSK